MRISDWSSDVCSSDLPCVLGNGNEDFRRNQTLGRVFPARQHFKAIEAACPKVDLLLIIRHGLTQRNTFTHARFQRSEEHTSELQSLMRISYAVFCLKKKNTTHNLNTEYICHVARYY